MEGTTAPQMANAATEVDQAAPALAWYENPKSLRYKITDWLGRKTRNPLLRPFAYASLAFHLEKDVEENARATPQPDEVITCLGLMCFDFFVPTTIDRLQAAFREAGWHRSDEFVGPRNICEWLREMRAHGALGTSWLELNRPKTPFSIGYDCELPEFVSHARATLDCVTPSLTTVSIFFRLTDSAQAAFDKELRIFRKSSIVAVGRGVRTVTPELARRQAINNVRTEWRSTLRQWMRKYFPGVISTNGALNELPACELVTGRNFSCFCEAREGRSEIASIAGLDFASLVFEEDTARNVRFARVHSFDNELGDYTALTFDADWFRRMDEESKRKGMSGLFRVEESFHKSWQQWSMLSILSFYERETNYARLDAVGALQERFPVSAVKRLRHLMATLTDIPTVCRELVSQEALDDLSATDGYAFALRPWSTKEKERKSLGQILDVEIQRRVPRLAASDVELKDFINAQASLISTYTNLWLQIGAVIFAVVSVIVGLATLS